MEGLDVMGGLLSAPSDLDCAEGRMMAPPEALVNGCQFVGRLLPEVQQCCLGRGGKGREVRRSQVHEGLTLGVQWGWA